MVKGALQRSRWLRRRRLHLGGQHRGHAQLRANGPGAWAGRAVFPARAHSSGSGVITAAALGGTALAVAAAVRTGHGAGVWAALMDRYEG